MSDWPRVNVEQLRALVRERNTLAEENKRLREALTALEKAVNESICGIRKPDIQEWNLLLSQAQKVLEVIGNELA